MSTYSVGPFEFDVWAGDAYPVWTRIRYQGVQIGVIRHDDLRHLEYGGVEARRLARRGLKEKDREEA